MHPLQMLLEIVKPWPHFFGCRAILPEALVLPALTMPWSDIVNTPLMSLEVVHGCKAVRSRATRDPTYMLFIVASRMFPGMYVSTISGQ
jgi:hypothetical protein